VYCKFPRGHLSLPITLQQDCVQAKCKRIQFTFTHAKMSLSTAYFLPNCFRAECSFRPAPINSCPQALVRLSKLLSIQLGITVIIFCFNIREQTFSNLHNLSISMCLYLRSKSGYLYKEHVYFLPLL
jgi:hypothetical protein